jgi:hypothetical protein
MQALLAVSVSSNRRRVSFHKARRRRTLLSAVQLDRAETHLHDSRTVGETTWCDTDLCEQATRGRNIGIKMNNHEGSKF